MRVAPLVALLFISNHGEAAELPRLTGTLIGPDERTALFAAEPGSTIQAAIGERIGDYVVSEIEPGRVELDKPDRHIVLSLSAAAMPAPASSSGVTFGLILRQPGPADD